VPVIMVKAHDPITQDVGTDHFQRILLLWLQPVPLNDTISIPVNCVIRNPLVKLGIRSNSYLFCQFIYILGRRLGRQWYTMRHAMKEGKKTNYDEGFNTILQRDETQKT
jgi:hypothetical protein